MAFEIKNLADAAFGPQAEVDNVDVDILVQGIKGEGVVTGCAVTAQATPDMTLAVAAGTVRIAGADVAVAGGNVTVTAADASNPRFDLVVVDDTGAKSVVAGTAAGTPEFPEVPADSVALAAVYVPAGDTAVESNQLTDKRVIVSSGGGGGNLDDLADVNAPSPNDDDRLAWDAGTSRWVVVAASAGMLDLDDLGDVDLTTTPPADGDGLVFDSGSGLWVPGAGSAGLAVEEDGVEEGTGITRLNFSTGLNVAVSGSEATLTSDSGGPSVSYIGYNTIGANQERTATNRLYLKQVTLAAGGLLTSIQAYVDAGAAGDLIRFNAVILTDNAGVPGQLISAAVTHLMLPQGASVTGRWFSLPQGLYLAAGTYWLGFSNHGSNINADLYYDTGGSDRTLAGTSGPSDWDYTGLTKTTTSNHYSIRGTFLSPL